jgi:enoyl-CoA hydratase/carnithine racemase
VSGLALGGGCELALSCDMIVASETASFGQPEILLGLIPGAGGTQRLSRLLGRQRAMELVLTGRRVPADEALAMGLVNRVVPVDRWRAEALALAADVAARPRLAARLAKQAVRAAESMPLDAGLEHERRLFEQALATADSTEGIAAFLAKRPPAFASVREAPEDGAGQA